MVATITSEMNVSQQHRALNKLRKPLVEKLRRDRINSSIEQLKSLLAPEFLNQQTDSKLEKADILEMTVSFLRQQQKQQPAFSSSSDDVRRGFSRCAREIVHFLSKEEPKTQSQRRLLKHFQNLEPAFDETKTQSVAVQLNFTDQQIISQEKRSALWRPW